MCVAHQLKWHKHLFEKTFRNQDRPIDKNKSMFIVIGAIV